MLDPVDGVDPFGMEKQFAIPPSFVSDDPFTVGTSANSDSRDDLLSRAGSGRGRKQKSGMSEDDAEALVWQARERGYKLSFIADSKRGKSGERYEKYRHFTSFAEVDQARGGHQGEDLGRAGDAELSEDRDRGSSE